MCCISVIKTSRLILCIEVIAANCEHHAKHTNMLCGQTEVFLMLMHVLQESTYCALCNTIPECLFSFSLQFILGYPS